MQNLGIENDVVKCKHGIEQPNVRLVMYDGDLMDITGSPDKCAYCSGYFEGWVAAKEFFRVDTASRVW